jgi:hypothetical protein
VAKRFTDTTKWRNEWFRTLPDRAKLAWVYLCDECDKAGIMKIDWGLATFQLRFKVSPSIFKNWFGSKIHFLSDDRILIVQFFEFQYSQSKDTWSAKVEARKVLENLGFSIVNNKLILSEESTVTPQCGDSVPTTLIRVRGRVSISINELREKIEKIYSEHYPLKKGRQRGVERLLKNFGPDDVALFEKAVGAYKADCERNKTEPRYIQHFSTFVGHWRDWLDPETGTSTVQAAPSKQEIQEYWIKEAHNIFKSIKDYGTKSRQVLGEERWSWVQSVGGYDFVNRIKFDDFGVKKLADMLLNNQSTNEGPT